MPLAVGLALCLLVRVVIGIWLALSKPEIFVGVDGLQYLDTARNIVAGHGYAISAPEIWDWERYQPDGLKAYPKLDAFRPPLYSIILAGWIRAFGENHVAIAIFNAVLSTVAGWFLFDLARRACSARVGFVTLLLYAFTPITAVLGVKIGSEPLFGLLFGASVWALWRAREDRPIVFSIVAGVCLGLAALTRSNAIFLWPLGCVWLFLAARRNRFTVVWFSLLLLLTLLPWAARNKIQMDRWIFLSGSGGYNFWLGNNEFAYRMFTARSTQEYDQWGKKLLDEVVPAKVQALGTNDLGVAQEFWYSEAKRYIREQPGEWFLLTGAKCIEFWRPYVRPGFFPKSYVVFSWVSTVPLFVLGWWGIVLLFRKRPALAWLLVAVVLAGMGGLVLSHVHVRLRAPFVEAFFAIPSAVVIAFCWERLRRNDAASSGMTGSKDPPPKP